MVLERSYKVELRPTIQTLFDMIHNVARQCLGVMIPLPRLARQLTKKQEMDLDVSRAVGQWGGTGEQGGQGGQGQWGGTGERGRGVQGEMGRAWVGRVGHCRAGREGWALVQGRRVWGQG